MSRDQEDKSINFAIIGCGGIFDRHLAAMEHIGGKLIAACDIDENKKKKMDSDIEFFDYPQKLFESKVFQDVDWVVVASPNDTHAELSTESLKHDKNVLVEKPASLHPKALHEIKNLALSKGKKIFTVLQLREHPELQLLRDEIAALAKMYEVTLELKMCRDETYFDGWKGSQARSGGLLYNIGVHYFDLLLWLFNEPVMPKVDNMDVRKANGTMLFQKANCEWSIDLTAKVDSQSRILKIGDRFINLTRMLESGHNRVYERLAEGEGTTLNDAEPSLRFCDQMTYGT